MEQMEIRLGSALDIDTRDKLLKFSKKIKNKEAYEIVGDPTILSKKNKKGSRYYKIRMCEKGVKELLGVKGYNLNCPDDMILVFVIRDKCCVTFKTNKETEIFSNLRVYSQGKNRERDLPDEVYTQI